MPMYGALTMLRNAEFGASNVTTTVPALGASIELTPAMRYDAEPSRPARRSHENLTSSAVTGEPSANVASGFNVNVNSVLSALASHSVARRGTSTERSVGATPISVS